MELIGIRTPVLRAGDDLAAHVMRGGLRAGDTVVVSSKAVATAEGAVQNLAKLRVSDAARAHSAATGIRPAFCEAIVRETNRLHGEVRGHCWGAILTEVHPEGMDGSILAPNAGMDLSNTLPGTAVGWPLDPVASVRGLWETLRSACGPHIGVIISDSCCMPRRQGVVAFALVAAGVEPVVSEVGHLDLFGSPLSITKEARADQLAIAANIVMGNAAQCCPAAIVRGHGCPASDTCGWVPGMARSKDLFAGFV